MSRRPLSTTVEQTSQGVYLFGNYMVIWATQMVHDSGEQVVSQRFEDLRQKMVNVARAALSCPQPQSVRSQGIIRTTTESDCYGKITIELRQQL
ncbi:hypothetical protein KIN20_011547 [Parelaphostrongylus tenuis]|uniref:Uncharacterized protein n=1 Tax=Parelaphostrongylus tenuis TaxID=148309 RepID=A0AAD5QMJ3_PARTN|nr:hypothetical protein KIN20_011547 [Parelaphostrongylus tenuis]